ncbi:baseplate protein [Actinoplanes sp. OR16]|uniref:GPW/gp25 family protein n=1 Tax=Actinoplanes sp. OR16 TaxID=946334 RepID=UPI000F6D1E0F|nr:GPW/gp25 family protein [Actinoplanes sp. OR16]BBH69378.1 baseplate protein [Actinoplanes sp. OR16]
MSDDFTGTGWSFPILPDEAGRLPYVSGGDSIRACLKALLLTAKGERVMRPDLGTRAPELLFAPDSARNLRDLEDSIREAILDFEPRVELDEVSAEPVGASRVDVRIEYRIRHTDTKANLVFPFYVDAAGTLP